MYAAGRRCSCNNYPWLLVGIIFAGKWDRIRIRIRIRRRASPSDSDRRLGSGLGSVGARVVAETLGQHNGVLTVVPWWRGGGLTSRGPRCSAVVEEFINRYVSRTDRSSVQRTLTHLFFLFFREMHAPLLPPNPIPPDRIPRLNRATQPLAFTTIIFQFYLLPCCHLLLFLDFFCHLQYYKYVYFYYMFFS